MNKEKINQEKIDLSDISEDEVSESEVSKSEVSESEISEISESENDSINFPDKIEIENIVCKEASYEDSEQICKNLKTILSMI